MATRPGPVSRTFPISPGSAYFMCISDNLPHTAPRHGDPPLPQFGRVESPLAAAPARSLRQGCLGARPVVAGPLPGRRVHVRITTIRAWRYKQICREMLNRSWRRPCPDHGVSRERFLPERLDRLRSGPHSGPVSPALRTARQRSFGSPKGHVSQPESDIFPREFGHARPIVRQEHACPGGRGEKHG